MVKIALQIKANLQNIDAFYPENEDDFSWTLKVLCTSCRENNPNWHHISKSDVHEITRADVNFVSKCKNCRNEGHILILSDNQVNTKKKSAAAVCKEYTSDDDGEFRTLVIMECRGLEPSEFEPREGWAVRSGRKLFSDVDLTDKEWYEYNEEDQCEVQITNIETQLIHLK